ncbi:MAG TPA: TatD family hydrolase [Caldilineaceae bacterium]|nr:TatD family hydrolase [Caldilineaceae bacterium]
MSPLTLIDSHCHLDAGAFDADRDEVLARAEAAGVEAIIVPGIDLRHCRQAVALASERTPVYAAVGIHPNSSDEWNPETAAALRTLAQAPKVVAYGEIGLDYYWDKVAPARQRAVFDEQLHLAAELGLPVIIHNREASEDVAAMLEAWVRSRSFAASPLAGRPYAGVLHAFGGDLALAHRAYAWNFVLSLGGPVTFQNARALHGLVPHLRRDRLMLETDAPYLTPHPHRGKRNEPAYVALVCEQIARLYGIEPALAAQESTALARRFFGLPPAGRSAGQTAEGPASAGAQVGERSLGSLSGKR